MRNCNKNCIGNVDGKCAVERCEGEIVRLGRPVHDTPERAAEFYNASREAFRYYFGQDGEG